MNKNTCLEGFVFPLQFREAGTILLPGAKDQWLSSHKAQDNYCGSWRAPK